MSLLLDTISYETADGLLNNNIADQNNLFYEARRKFLALVYGQAYLNVSPANTWLENNRVFFGTGSTGFDYVIGGKTYPISPLTLYCCAPSEYPRILEQATALGLEVTSDTFGAWQGVGSLETFYW